MRTGTIVVLVLLALTAVGLAGDLTIKSTIESKGMVGMLNMQGTQQTTVSGDKSREESTIKMTSKMMKMLGAGKPQETVQITRLDKELFWELKPKDKEYTEMTFEAMRAQMEAAMADARKERGEDKGDSVKMKTDVTVERTGKTQTIAGYNTEQVLVMVTFKGENTESGESGEFKVNLDMWLSKDIPGMADYQDFHKRLAEKLGLYGPNETFSKAFASLGADDKAIWEKMGDLEGIPLMTTMTAVPMSDSLATAMKDAEKQQAEAKEKSNEPEESESIDPTTVSQTDTKAAASKALKGLFGKKKDKKSDVDKGKETKQNSSPYLFHIVNTVTEISTTPAAASSFDIPEGYKKK